MSKTTIDVPKVGFSFDLCRSEMFLKNGVQSPSYQKMGKTIIGLIFQDGVHLMDKVGLVEGALFELTHEHQLRVEEEIRNQISVLETDLMCECEKSTSALVQVEKYRDARQEMDRKLDTQYQRKIAETLDNHLTAVQWDHELRSQIEERMMHLLKRSEENLWLFKRVSCSKKKLKQKQSSYEKQIARWIKQITGTKESVRAKANELIQILNDPCCPQSISLAAFAEKVFSQCERPTNAAFACAHVIVLVTSQVPHAMDILLAEFHRACINTVPKHIYYSKSAFKSKNGKIETDKDYLKRLESYMKLYGALVQCHTAPSLANSLKQKQLTRNLCFGGRKLRASKTCMA